MGPTINAVLAIALGAVKRRNLKATVQWGKDCTFPFITSITFMNLYDFHELHKRKSKQIPFLESTVIFLSFKSLSDYHSTKFEIYRNRFVSRKNKQNETGPQLCHLNQFLIRI